MMKKIIAIALILACAFTMFACGGGSGSEPEVDPIDAAIQEIDAMYKAIRPIMVHTETKRDFGTYSLVDESTLTIGTVDGFNVTVYEYKEQQLRDIDSGSKAEILDYIQPSSGKLVYHEEQGLRETKDGVVGKWDPDGVDFAPTTGANALTITKETVSDFVIDADNKTYSFTVLAANTEAVLGEAVDYDVKVVIAHSGADIVSVELSYVEDVSKTNKNFPKVNVNIKTTYSYESQSITID